MDKEALTQAVDSALNYDYTFFDDAMSRLFNQELLNTLDAQIHLIKNAIYNYDDMVFNKEDYSITDPNKDELIPKLGDKVSSKEEEL